MWKRIIAAFFAPALLIALPVFLRPAEDAELMNDDDADELVIISPHSESIRHEFEHGFRKFYKEKTGRHVRIDWRSVGGTNDITRYIRDQYTAQFRMAWEKNQNRSVTDDELKSFCNAKYSGPDRKFFLDSDIGIGIDLFFGGGSFEHQNFARIGFAVDGGVQKRHPEFFAPELVPQEFAGETIYDPEGRYYGACLASFGIASNPDRYADAGLPQPQAWTDLMDDRLFQKIALADPTKSGSIMKCYEMILQQAMAEQGPEKGWIEGFRRIKLIAANARYATDSAGKLVRDVSSGAVMAGMAIDFYGFSEAKWTEEITGKPRLIYTMPENGSSISCDCVQMLRGAPHRKTAELFLDFLLSPEGQRLWLQKPGTPGGPEKYALLRFSVRRDLLKTIPAEYLSIPDYDPYRAAGTFRYHGEWTGRYFGLIRVMIKCLVLDPMDDLREAKRAIQDSKDEQAKTAALDEIAKMPAAYPELNELAKRLSSANAVESAGLRREWTDFAVRQYRKAAESAGGSR